MNIGREQKGGQTSAWSSEQLLQEAQLHSPQGTTSPFPVDHWGKGPNKGKWAHAQ